MIDMTPLEQEAMRSCLKSFGEVAESIGFDKPLGVYSEVEALQVIDAIVTRYVDAMAEHHERSKYPPVRMPGTKPISDPIRASEKTADNPFADMKDDLPWEEK